MCREAREGRAIDYDTLLADVDGVAPFAALIDPDDARFLAPQHMPVAINAYLQEHGQMQLSAPATFARCIMESLVLRYREVFHQIGRLTGTTIRGVHVLGGGARNVRLNQWLADEPAWRGVVEAMARAPRLLAACRILFLCRVFVRGDSAIVMSGGTRIRSGRSRRRSTPGPRDCGVLIADE